MFLHDDVIAGAQPQARPLAGQLGGEERVEDARGEGLRDTRAVIFNFHHHSVLAGPRADGDPALPAQRVDGIGQDVGEDLVQLAAVSLDRRQLWGIVALYFDAGQARAQDEQGILQAGVYVDSLDRSLIQKSVRFQLLNDGRYAGRALRHVVGGRLSRRWWRAGPPGWEGLSGKTP